MTSALADFDAPAPVRRGMSPAERIELEQNDADNAVRLISAFGDRIIYVHGKGWAVVEGGRFSFADGELRAFEIGMRLRSLVEEEVRAVYDWTPPDHEVERRVSEERAKKSPEFFDAEGAIAAIRGERYAALSKHATRCGNVDKVEKALKAMRHQCRVAIGDLDGDPGVMVLPNGLLDLDRVAATRWPEGAIDEEIAEIKAGWLRPHDLASFPTKQAGAEFDPAADCPEWRAFMELILPRPSIRACVQRCLGMLLFGRNDAQVVLLLRGPGGNGKSTLTAALREVLGEYAAACKIELFLNTGPESAGRPTPEEVDLPGVRALIASEPDPSDELSSKKLKSMTGGDPRPARALGMPQFIYRPSGVPILSFNRTPRIKGDDHGTRRRLVFIPFEVDLTKLPPEKRRAQREIEAALKRERPGILNWLLEGFIQFRSRGIDPPEEMLALKEDLLADGDPVGQFIADCCVEVPDGLIGTQEFFRVYQEWCERSGAQEFRPRTFTGVMVEKRIDKKKTGGGRMFWKGLAWAPGDNMRSLLETCGYGGSAR